MLRKCRKSEEKIRWNKLLEACLNNNVIVFDEVEKLRKCKIDQANSMDWCSKGVENYFANNESLYTSIDDKAELDQLGMDLNQRFNKQAGAELGQAQP